MPAGRSDWSGVKALVPTSPYSGAPRRKSGVGIGGCEISVPNSADRSKPFWPSTEAGKWWRSLPLRMITIHACRRHGVPVLTCRAILSQQCGADRPQPAAAICRVDQYHRSCRRPLRTEDAVRPARQRGRWNCWARPDLWLAGSTNETALHCHRAFGSERRAGNRHRSAGGADGVEFVILTSSAVRSDVFSPHRPATPATLGRSTRAPLGGKARMICWNTARGALGGRAGRTMR